MHKQSLECMKELFKKWSEPDGSTVLDVGSFDVNGSYRDIIEETHKYMGVDICEGKNVDLVVGKYEYPFSDNSFNYVISGQCMEHVEEPWIWFSEVVRVTKKRLFIIAPWKSRVHRYPVDCWRILPDAFKHLAKINNLKVLECGRKWRDSFLCAEKITNSTEE